MRTLKKHYNHRQCDDERLTPCPGLQQFPMISIRPSKFDDISAIAEFQQKLAIETEHINLNLHTVTTGIEALFTDPGKGVYYVAESQGNIIGCFLITYEWSDWRNGWFWWIQSVYIRPEARGQRIYSKLYEFLKRRAAAEGNVCGFRLYAETDNRHAQMVYKKVGMNAPRYVMFEEEI